jgi:hypothetical protein
VWDKISPWLGGSAGGELPCQNHGWRQRRPAMSSCQIVLRYLAGRNMFRENLIWASIPA